MAADPPNFRKYGIPFYSAAWVPYKNIKSDRKEDRNQSSDEVPEGDKSSPALESAAQDYVVFAGGGGEGRNGISNAVVLSRFDFAGNDLSDMPVARIETGSDLPYRMAVHPGGDGLVCSFSKSCSYVQEEKTVPIYVCVECTRFWETRKHEYRCWSKLLLYKKSWKLKCDIARKHRSNLLID